MSSRDMSIRRGNQSVVKFRNRDRSLEEREGHRRGDTLDDDILKNVHQRQVLEQWRLHFLSHDLRSQKPENVPGDSAER